MIHKDSGKGIEGHKTSSSQRTWWLFNIIKSYTASESRIIQHPIPESVTNLKIRKPSGKGIEEQKASSSQPAYQCMWREESSTCIEQRMFIMTPHMITRSISTNHPSGRPESAIWRRSLSTTHVSVSFLMKRMVRTACIRQMRISVAAIRIT